MRDIQGIQPNLPARTHAGMVYKTLRYVHVRVSAHT